MALVVDSTSGESDIGMLLGLNDLDHEVDVSISCDYSHMSYSNEYLKFVRW